MTPNELETLIETLSALFPVFRAQPWLSHRPLAVGAYERLVEAGVVQPEEAKSVLRKYCSRLMYRRAVAAGGPRYGLDGAPDGEVTPNQQRYAQRGIEQMLARRRARAASEPKPVAPPQTAAQPSRAPRDGLDALRAAARGRREMVDA